MEKNMMDKLIEKIQEKKSSIVMGIDPKYEMLPDCIKSKYPKTLDGFAKATVEFFKNLIDETNDIIPAVKPQLAYFEMMGATGLKAFKEIVDYAKEKKLIVIADAKRGDIGTTSQAYSNAFLGRTSLEEFEEEIYDVDFITVNPYMGTDCVKPFIEDSKKYNKGVFVLVKTSNKSSGELQDLKLENGNKVYEQVVSLVEKWGEDLRGKYGYSSISAVVGATYPEQLKELREKAPHTFFLIPGYGAQGGKAKDIALGFNKNGIGGIVNASRSLMTAYKSDLWKEKFTEEEYAKATRSEAIRMRDELNQAIEKEEFNYAKSTNI